MSDEESEVSSEDRLKALRGGNRASVTKVEKEVLMIIQEGLKKDPAEIGEVNIRLNSKGSTLRKKLSYLKELDQKILKSCPNAEVAKEIEEATSWEERIHESLSRIEEFKKGRYPRQTVPAVVAGPSYAGGAADIYVSSPTRVDICEQVDQVQHGFRSTRSQNGFRSSPDRVSLSEMNVSHAGVRLPKINLPKFDGDITRFIHFWQSFECAVHRNDSIPIINKLNYLFSLLEGPAYRAVEGLEFQERNYENVIDVLKSRFGKRQHIVTAHMQALLKLQNHPNANTQQLRSIYDKINVNVRGLQALGMPAENYGNLLIPIIMARMPREITMQVARKTATDEWDIEEILGIIQTELEANEISANLAAADKRIRSQDVTPSRIQGTTKSFVARQEVRQKRAECKLQCYYCQGSHVAGKCDKVSSVEERRKILKEERRCFNCLKKGHFSSECNSRNGYSQCKGWKGKHHYSICLGELSNSKPAENDKGSESTTVTAKERGNILLQTATGYVYNGSNKNQCIKVQMLFDLGSQRSYVTEELMKKLNLDVECGEMLNLNTFGSSKFAKVKCNRVSFFVKLNDYDDVEVSALTHKVICSPLRTRVDLGNHAHLRGLSLADSSLGSNGKIDVLIGADRYYDFIVGDIVRGSAGPVATKSKLGWLLSGATPNFDVEDSEICTNTVSHLVLDKGLEYSITGEADIGSFARKDKDSEELIEALNAFWKAESCGIHETPDGNEDETEPLNIQHNGKRYKVGLPWKHDYSDLPDDYDYCLSRLNAVHSRLKARPQLLKDYDDIFQTQIEEGIIERVPDAELDTKHHFMSHHCVIREDKDTTKVRIVFDGSAKYKHDKSLNDCLEVGMNYMPLIFDTLVRFRLKSVAMTADVEKAFHQIAVEESDRDALRFLWYDNPGNEVPNVIQLRFTRLPFGLKCSPGILGATIHHHVVQFKDRHPEACEVLSKLYADDLAAGAETVGKAFDLYRDCKAIMKQGSFNLRKWNSNDKELLERIDLSEGQVSKVESRQLSKVLGVTWNTEVDNLGLDLRNVLEVARTLPPTKRSVLKIAAKIFDPVGCLSFFVVKLKIFFQELCEEKVPWDEEFEGPRRRKYTSLVNEIEAVQGVSIPRHLFEKGKDIETVQIHAFSDASESAYACVIYLRAVYKSGEVSVRFICSKAKVAPLKRQTIPRLELLGAVLMSKLVHNVKEILRKELDQEGIETCYWVDSMATLCWIKNDRVLKQYVGNRIREILQVSSREEWYFFPGSLNPADFPSRAKAPPNILSSSCWWEGPDYLKFPFEEWPRQINIGIEGYKTDEERVQVPVTVSLVSEVSEERNILNVVDIQRYSSLVKLRRTVAWVMRFVSNLQALVGKKSRNVEKYVSAEETHSAEVMLIKDIQKRAFGKELEFIQSKGVSGKRPAIVNQLNLFADEKGVMRCRSRLENAPLLEASKTPILLPSKTYFSELVVAQAHEKVFHDGVRETLSAVREKYWILRGREVVKRFVRRCKKCVRFEGKPFEFNVTPVCQSLE